jgi:hypothetical protein
MISGLFASILAPSLGVIPALSLQLDGRPWNPYLRGYPLPSGILSDAPPWLCHTEPLIHRCCPSYMEVRVVAPLGAAVALPLFPVITQGASGPLLHRRHAGRRVPKWTRWWYWRRILKFSAEPTPESVSWKLLRRWGISPPMSPARLTSWMALSLGHSCCNVLSGDSHYYSLSSYQTFFLPYSSVCV